MDRHDVVHQEPAPSVRTSGISGQPLVSTSYGTVRGIEREGCCVFRGVPFASKPRRFRRPERLQPWEGVRNCQKFGKMAVQISITSMAILRKVSLKFALASIGFSKGAPSEIRSLLSKPSKAVSEDCLFLNITSPSLTSRAPVLCFIHGGAFQVGAGSQMIYDGLELARRHGVLVVSINYRLGCFGYLNIPGGDPNCGLWDQIEALRWIQSEIHNFGGDPERVTICGESAGGMSCGLLLSCPVAQPLFHRAILMSGALSNVLTAEDACTVSRRLCKIVGVDANAELLEEVSVERLLAAQNMMFGSSGFMPFQPCIDGELILDYPRNLLQSGNPLLAKKQIIVGTTAQEFNLFIPPQLSLVRSKESLDATTSKVTSILGPSRLASTSAESEEEITESEIRDMLKTIRAEGNLQGWREAYSDLLTMLVFRGPAYLAAECLSNVVERVYVYSFDFDAGRIGPAHISELPLLFGTHQRHWFFAEVSGAKKDPATANAVSHDMMSRFAAFVSSGVPDALNSSSADSKLSWPPCPVGRVSDVFSFKRRSEVIRNADSPALRQIMDYVARARRPFGVRIKVDSRVVPKARL